MYLPGRLGGGAQDAPGILLVILVDQFEEVFTLCRNEDLRGAFIRTLTRGGVSRLESTF
jgi:hypothetical protein